MTRRKLIEYIKHPHLLTELSIEELQQWIEEFPYSQNLRLLLAQKIKSLGQEEDYPEVFHNAAMHSSDREGMYEVLNSADIEPVEEKPIVLQTEEESVEDHVAIGDEALPIDSKSNVNTPVEHFDQFHDLPFAGSSEPLDYLQEDDLKDGALIQHKDEQGEPSYEEIIETKIGEKEGLESADGPLIAELNSSDLDKTIISDAVDTEGPPIVDDEENDIGLSTFSQWLIGLENSDSSDEEEESDDDDYQATEDLASETLADLLVSQGHMDKAIVMYQKLSLDYPEKSTYFAAQIEKIKRT